MRRFIVVGLGNFGANVAESLYAQGHEVLAIDANEDAVDRITPHVTRAIVGDAREIEVLRKAGAADVDAAIVGTGDDITASILTTMALRDLGVDSIYAKVISLDHARVMARMGVSEAIFPERETAFNLAARLSGQSVLKYVRIAKGFGIQEMTVPSEWEGKTLRELQLPKRYGISIVAVHDVLTDGFIVPPDPDARLKDSDALVAAGREDHLREAAEMS